MTVDEGNGSSRSNVREVDETLFFSDAEAAPNYEEFKGVLDSKRHFFTTRNAVNEPYFYYAPEPPCGMYALRYAQDNKPAHHKTPVLLYEFPPPRKAGNKKQHIVLWDTLLNFFNDPMAGSRYSAFDKAHQLKAQFAANCVELLMFTHLHNLMSHGRGTPLLSMFHHIMSVLQSEVKPIHVLFVGEVKVSNQFFFQNTWIARRIESLRFKK